MMFPTVLFVNSKVTNLNIIGILKGAKISHALKGVEQLHDPMDAVGTD